MTFLLQNKTAVFHIPDNTPQAAALSRTTHLAIGAHQDDLEIMAYHGIVACLGDEDKWFTGVTCTNGAGSARTGPFAHYSNDQMMAIRVEEQNQAADLGRYSAMLQLGYPSTIVKDPASTELQDELTHILMATKPEIVYTHNPADKHPTHIGIVIPTLLALRAMPTAVRPEKVIGCEVWRDLDWMPDEDKVAMDVSDRENMATALVALFDSQIAGGKRYDLATMGRRRANATYYSSHAVDEVEQIAFGMDLTPLIKDDSLDIVEYVQNFIQKFNDDVMGNLNRQLGR